MSVPATTPYTGPGAVPLAPSALANRTSSSGYGKAIPIVWGTQRVSGNVILSGRYVSVYTGQAMNAGLIQLAVCEGPAAQILRIWREKVEDPDFPNAYIVYLGNNVFAYDAAKTYAKGDWVRYSGTNYVSLQAANVGHTPSSSPTWWAARGTSSERAQTPWSALNSFSGWALGYGGTVLVNRAAGFDINSQGELWRTSFEVSGFFTSATGAAQKVPATAILVDLLTNAEYGLGLPTSRLDGYGADPIASSRPAAWTTGPDGTAASSFYNAQYAFSGFAYALEDPRPARDIVQDFLDAMEAAAVWSGGKLKVISLRESDSTGTRNYTPFLAPVYDLGYSAAGADFLASPGEDFLEIEREPLKDRYNCFPIEWVNPSPSRVDANGAAITETFNAYQTEVTEGTPDPVDVAKYGLRKATKKSFRFLVTRADADLTADALARQSVNKRNRFRFRLGWRFALLEAGDLVTVTDAGLGYSRQLARIEEIEEDEDGAFDVVALELSTQPTAPAAAYVMT